MIAVSRPRSSTASSGLHLKLTLPGGAQGHQREHLAGHLEDRDFAAERIVLRRAGLALHSKITRFRCDRAIVPASPAQSALPTLLEDRP